MLYPDLVLPTVSDRPFFFANFVQTLDGKIQVTSNPKGYWPLGSTEDFDTLIGLRAYADVLIHGKGTATAARAVERLASEDFQSRRKSLGKTDPILYVVVSGHPSTDLAPILSDIPPAVEVLLVTIEEAVLPPELSSIPTRRLGKNEVSINLLSGFLHSLSKQTVLVEGGATLFGSFLKEKLIDELFLTISPKILGNLPGQTITLVENVLFSPDEVRNFELISQITHMNELYLRYRMTP